MVDMPARLSTFDSAAPAQLACPACYGELRPKTLALLCVACGRAYPIVDGIPVLIIERAELRPSANR
jgi:uncharacterized protein YbaR (Trm112 family)